MPGITMIGEKRRAGHVSTALPPEARALSRMLHLLKSSATASTALMGSLSQIPASPQRDEIQTSLQTTLGSLLTLDLPFKQTSDRISIATELAIRMAFQNPVKKKHDRKKNSRRSGNDDGSDTDSLVAPAMTTMKTSTTAAALVSDNSMVDSESETETALDTVEASLQIKKFWGSLLEAVNLQVASRTTSVWGKKKTYEVYQLTAPASLDSSRDEIRKAVEREFRTVFHGGGEDQSGCRTYAVTSEKDKMLYIQMNIGKQYDFNDERNRSVCGEKKKKADYEFIAIVTGGSPLIALTASRAPSRSRLTKFVLTALDAALCKSSNAKTTKGRF